MCFGKQATLTVLMSDALPGFRDQLTTLIDIIHAFIKVLNLAGGEIYIKKVAMTIIKAGAVRRHILITPGNSTGL